MVDRRNPHEFSVGKYEGKNKMGAICMGGGIIFRRALEELILGCTVDVTEALYGPVASLCKQGN
jgi:hypothetical protein